jgi:uncharacterized protein (UPF0335 family)
MDWPNEQLEGIVETVSRLEEESSLESLLRLCVPE